jgi:hypothetical protein
VGYVVPQRDSSDDHANAGDWDNATVISLDGSGDGSAQGTIPAEGDDDLFEFAPAHSGWVEIEVVASDSELDPQATAYLGRFDEIDHDDGASDPDVPRFGSAFSPVRPTTCSSLGPAASAPTT